MKQTIIALLVSFTSATWGEWDGANYCSYEQDVVGQEKIESDFYYSQDQCASFCEQSDQQDTTISYGTSLCCDYEQWADGSYDCTLYKGNTTVENQFVNDGSGDEFQSMTFESGDYRYSFAEYIENIKESMIDEGCDQSCVNDVFSAGQENFEEIASTCGCPEFMLNYNKANTVNLF